MTQEVEIEFKNLLTKNEFNRLLNELPFPSSSETQTNYYFETKDLALKAHKSALRIREKNDTYTLTLKEPREVGLLETHEALTRQEAKEMIENQPVFKKEIDQQLLRKNISFEDLIYYGSLKTERREIRYQGVLLVLDYSIYNGKTDYELELEATSEEAGRKVFEDLLEKHNIPRRRTPNKIKRLFSTF
ncbi:CYTH domain-containing protein [Virgibacillus oceani]